MSPKDTPRSSKVATGSSGLDAILGGGFPRHWIYMIQGEPGTGKTTLGLQFLLEGVRVGERVLYITLSHTERELSEIARSHGWSLGGVPVHEFSAGEAAAYLSVEQTVFHTADVELKETTDAILEVINRLKPERLVFDPIDQVRLLSNGPLRYRKQLLTLKQALTDLECTALFLTSEPAGKDDQEVQPLVHGGLELEQRAPDYGEVRRRLRVNKGRGMRYRGGYHSFRILTGGLEVYPRLEPSSVAKDTDEAERTAWKGVESGVAGLDALFGGGIDEGTACLLVGPTGTGKSSLATLYTYAAALRGERSAVFLFDERLETFYRRSEGLGMDLRPQAEAGLVRMQQIDTGELSPGEFTHTVRRAVDEGGARVVVIDSLTGYLNAMPQETLLIPQLHELLSYLSQQGVLTLLIMTERGVLGGGELEPVDISYLTDTVLLLRRFEAEGQLRRAISVIKKRYGFHESTIRELRITAAGLEVGEPLTAFRGILTGSPLYQASDKALLPPQDEAAQDEAASN